MNLQEEIAALKADKQPNMGNDIAALRDLIRRAAVGNIDLKSLRGFAIQWCIIDDPELTYKATALKIEKIKAQLADAETELRRLEGL